MCGVGDGVNGGWMPLPTRPQWYCDPASLVLKRFVRMLVFFGLNGINYKIHRMNKFDYAILDYTKLNSE